MVTQKITITYYIDTKMYQWTLQSEAP